MRRRSQRQPTLRGCSDDAPGNVVAGLVRTLCFGTSAPRKFAYRRFVALRGAGCCSSVGEASQRMPGRSASDAGAQCGSAARLRKAGAV